MVQVPIEIGRMRLALVPEMNPRSLPLKKWLTLSRRFAVAVQGGQVFIRHPQNAGSGQHLHFDPVPEVAFADSSRSLGFPF